MASKSLSSRGAAYKTLLDAARGLLLPADGGCVAGRRRRILRCFPLAERHVVKNLSSPLFESGTTTTTKTSAAAVFHETLCHKIRAARHRVYLASLYIGPAATSASAGCPTVAGNAGASSVKTVISVSKEQELLDALTSTSARSVQILLDQNRALRPVPVERKQQQQQQPHHRHPPSPVAQDEEEETSITSAEACHRVLDRRRKKLNWDSTSNANDEKQCGSGDGIFLLNVLPNYQQKLLKNPLNEVAGVFHLKCYIMDHDMVITGANLSEEYFVDRTDRYLWITSGEEYGEDEANSSKKSHPLVECYADMVQALCQHAEPYKPFPGSTSTRRTTRQELLDSLTEILTQDSIMENLTGSEEYNDDDIVAYAVPTLQTPPGFFRGHRSLIPADTDITASLIEQSASSVEHGEIYIASAYLNPTDQLWRAVTSSGRVTHFLTAGLASHGFKPKNKPGNKGKTWIPAVYDTLGRRLIQKNANLAHLWYYVRPGWTFHCKGLWLTAGAAERMVQEESILAPKIGESSTVSAVIAGSGNFGYRSAVCDMESNVILVFTKEKSQMQMGFCQEWNDLCKHARSADQIIPLVLQWPFRLLLPVIRYFF